MAIADGALIFKARNSIEARSLAAHLANAGVDAHVSGEIVENIFGVPNLGASGPEVWVRSEDRDAAEELIDAWRREHEGPAIVDNETPRFSLKAIFKVTALVAAVAATSRLFGGDLQGFMTAATLWFWSALIFLSARAAFRRSLQDDYGDAD